MNDQMAVQILTALQNINATLTQLVKEVQALSQKSPYR